MRQLPRSETSWSVLILHRVFCLCCVTLSAEPAGYSWLVDVTETNQTSVRARYIIPDQWYQIKERGMVCTSRNQRACVGTHCAFPKIACALTSSATSLREFASSTGR